MSSTIRHNRVRILLTTFVCCSLVFLASLFVQLPEKDFNKEDVHSLRVVDRNGILLREFLNDQEGRGQWRTLNQIAPAVINAVIATEDKRFWLHPGVDPLAIARAVYENCKSGALHVGGSTLTQQVIRNVYHHPRTVLNKALETWLALRLERMMSKSEILEQYLNRAPFGNQLTGIEAASRYYFQKPAIDLSLAEAAFLVGLPNAPTSLNPYQNMNTALLRQQTVLRRMVHQGVVRREEYQRAVVQPICLIPPDINFRAPHAVQMAMDLVHDSANVSAIKLTIDYPLQREVQWIVRNHLSRLKKKNVTNAAVVVLENRTGEIRTMVGSADFFNDRIGGQVNGAVALRQPGSAVKPFMYVRALGGRFTPATVLPDLPTHIPDDRGDYIPENYDKRYHGPVRLRTALACSYNVPAVRVVESIGIGTLYQSMQDVGITSLTQPVEYYGYGLTLGNAEVSLLELTNAYRSLANGGLWLPSTLIRALSTIDGTESQPVCSNPDPGARHRVYDEQSTFLVTDILRDPVARRPAFGNAFRFPFPCAVKTGTTKDYRDNWTIGYTTGYTVGVWAGNFDGSPMHGVSGVAGAGQIFYDVMMILHEHSQPHDFPRPDGLVHVSVCPRSGKLPNEFCEKTIKDWFIRGSEPGERCDIHQAYRVTNRQGVAGVKVFEMYPSEYNQWMSQERISSPPLGAVSIGSRTSRTSKSDRLAILSPNQGDFFKIDPVLRSEYQAIKIVASIPGQLTDVRLRVNNGEQVPFSDAETWWTLKKGTQQLRLEARDKNRVVLSRAITIEVE